MDHVLDFVQSAQFNNFYKCFDKKLTKNILKRCIVDPFDSVNFSSFKADDIKTVNRVLAKILDAHHMLTQNLKDWLRDPVRKYVQILSDKNHPQFEEISALAEKCKLSNVTFDLYSLDGITDLFKNKQPHKIEKILQVLHSLCDKAFPENTVGQRVLDKKYIK